MMTRGRRSAALRAISGGALFALLVWLSALQLGQTGRAPLVQQADAQALEPGVCLGDEKIRFAPAQPLADEPLLISVTSAQHHRGVYLHGQQLTAPMREYGSDEYGWTWDWQIA